MQRKRLNRPNFDHAAELETDIRKIKASQRQIIYTYIHIYIYTSMVPLISCNKAGKVSEAPKATESRSRWPPRKIIV